MVVEHTTLDSMSVESCSSSMACDVDEVCSASLRKMKDMEVDHSDQREKQNRCGGWNWRVKRRSHRAVEQGERRLGES